MFDKLYPNLFLFISERNQWNVQFGDPVIDLQQVLTPTQIDELYNEMECQLSPENLHCDGEISNSEADAKYDHLVKCAEQLGKLTGDVREVD